MTRYDLPALAKAGPASWARFKADCADFHDRLAVEFQTEFPTHIIPDFPDLNPNGNRRGILAARDEYVAHLGGLLATLNTLKRQALEQAADPDPDEEEEDWENREPTADDDGNDNSGEDEVPDSPAPCPVTPVAPPQVVTKVTPASTLFHLLSTPQTGITDLRQVLQA